MNRSSSASDAGPFPSPEQFAACAALLFGASEVRLGDQVEPSPVGRGPRVEWMVARDRLADELLEDRVDERASVERVDGETSFGFLHVFDTEHVPE